MSTWRENVLGMMELVETQLNAASRMHGILRLEVERVIKPPTVKPVPHPDLVTQAAGDASGAEISTIRYISIATASNVSGHSETVLYKAARDGKLKTVTVAGRTGVTPTELSRFMRSPDRPRRLHRSASR